ncbi:hypothetical protein MTBPR1_40150 [Candidatus Terasakiella magnetica]|uniref:Uncharacterized protein n=1 Tax=Candidatus Terasakiella magnetica TaxID=1867952 RepID=A0A1C3RIL4_9PROT|nr:hypothetical protein MTBPR1_40150 [Candidatus Terasakiella magnetica]
MAESLRVCKQPLEPDPGRSGVGMDAISPNCLSPGSPYVLFLGDP